MKFIEFNLNTGELARFALKAFDSGNVCVPCLCATVCVCVSHEYSLDLKDTDSIQESSALTSHGYRRVTGIRLMRDLCKRIDAEVLEAAKPLNSDIENWRQFRFENSGQTRNHVLVTVTRNLGPCRQP